VTLPIPANLAYGAARGKTFLRLARPTTRREACLIDWQLGTQSRRKPNRRSKKSRLLGNGSQ